MPARINDGTEIAMPLRNLVSIVAAVAVGVWAYFGIVERLNTIETSLIMMEKEVELNSDFRVRWPRGELGSLPADAEQFMLLGHLETQLDKLVEEVESGSAPVDRQQQLTLEWYAERIQQLETQVEYLRGNGR
mgnify:FL=1|tara:strand:+ start:10651 stop:11049 length:399 start_codon:yes stop_codon:yes gene_type:complete